MKWFMELLIATVLVIVVMTIVYFVGIDTAELQPEHQNLMQVTLFEDEWCLLSSDEVDAGEAPRMTVVSMTVIVRSPDSLEVITQDSDTPITSQITIYPCEGAE